MWKRDVISRVGMLRWRTERGSGLGGDGGLLGALSRVTLVYTRWSPGQPSKSGDPLSYTLVPVARGRRGGGRGGKKRQEEGDLQPIETKVAAGLPSMGGDKPTRKNKKKTSPFDRLIGSEKNCVVLRTAKTIR